MAADNAPTNGSLAKDLFDQEDRGTFAEGQIFISAPDLELARRDPANGYWHCEVDRERLNWSDKVYELFGVEAGTSVERDWAVSRYTERSRDALERIRKYALSRDYGFILDAEICVEGAGSRWIRVLAVPILSDGRVVGLHGLKRAL